MENQRKCQLAVCGCRTQDGKPYCSDDCEQAASQAITRDFCQCAHEGCEKPVHHIHADGTMDFPDVISSTPGWLTIEYSSFENLRSQLLSLAQTIDTQSKDALPFRTETPPRRNPSTELKASAWKAQSA